MRILHLTTGLSTQSAVYRLHKGLLTEGVESYIYTGLKSFNEKEIFHNKNDLKLKITARFERLLFNLYPNMEKKPWNIGFFKNTLDEIINEINPDIIHLHWINQFVSIKQISKFKKPIVWTLHDSWPFTGGCHIPYPCENFKDQCKNCPQLKSKIKFDLSNTIFKLKKKSWNNSNINIIAPSKWMGQCAYESSIFSSFQISNIANCIDTNLYIPKDKVLSRKKLNLPLKKDIILFGANNAIHDKNKGYDLLLNAFNIVKNIRNNVELVIFGSKEIKYTEHTKIREIGFIKDYNIFPYLYSAADVTINASRSENFSNVILESLSCGTPVVAFNIGGNSDLIINNINGKLVAPFNEVMMANAIIDLLNNSPSNNKIHLNIKQRFSTKDTIYKHINLYKSIY
jgi:Glycosyltransferase